MSAIVAPRTMKPQEQRLMSEQHIEKAHALEARAEKLLTADHLGAELLPDATKRTSKTRIGYVKGLREVARIVDALRPTKAVQLLELADQEYWRAALIWTGRARKAAYKISKAAGTDPEDLTQEALHGLYRAAQRFEEGHDAKFSTYSSHWILNALARSLCPSDAVSLPVHAVSKLISANREYGQAPKSEVLQQARAARYPVRLDAPLGDADGRRRIDFMEGNGKTADDEVYSKQTINLLQSSLGMLSPRDRRIVSLRFGLDGSDPLTLREVGQKFKLSRQRIWQIIVDSMQTLRRGLESTAAIKMPSHRPEHKPLPVNPLAISGVKLWPHQADAVSGAVEGFKTGSRGQVIMPCGSGKTLVAIHIAKETNSQRILLAFPSLALLAQTLHAWRESPAFAGFPFLAVCSDGPTDVKSALEPAEILKFAAKHSRYVIFTTYQSAHQVVSADLPKAFDLAVLDEAHRCVGAVDKQFGVLLLPDFKAHRRLAMTATARTFSKTGIAHSMDDPKVFGPAFYRLFLVFLFTTRRQNSN